MTLQERESIFAKECVTVKDLMQLYELSYCSACKMMRELKHESDRLRLRGKIHFEDYFAALKLKTNRYFIFNKIEELQLPERVVKFNDWLTEHQRGAY